MNEPLRLPFPPELTEAGVQATLLGLQHGWLLPVGNPIQALRERVASLAAELAVNRLLVERHMPVERIDIPRHEASHRTSLVLGGRRVYLFNSLVSRRGAIYALRKRAQVLQRALVLVPMEQADAIMDHRTLMLFSYTLGLVTNRQEEYQLAVQKGLPTRLIWLPPERWSQRPGKPAVLRATLKSNCDHPLQIDILGADETGKPARESIVIPPKQPQRLAQRFQTIVALLIDQVPRGQLGVHIPAERSTQVIHRIDWKNIWIYGMEVILAGAAQAVVFNHQARRLPAGSDVFPHPTTRFPTLACQVSDLISVELLMDRIRAAGPAGTIEPIKNSRPDV
jgi:hypothetical protein